MLFDHRLLEQIQPELRSDEEVLWLGHPNAFRTALRYLPQVLGGIVFCLIILNFERDWNQTPGPRPDIFFSILPLLMGLAVALSPVSAFVSARNTAYAITNDRVLIVEKGSILAPRRVSSFGKRDLGIIRTEVRGDNSGNLIFAQQSYSDTNGTTRVRDIRFTGIPEVRQVEGILRADFGREI